MFKRVFLFSAWPLLAAVLCAVAVTNSFSLARSRAPVPNAPPTTPTARFDTVAERPADNPAVQPGKVRWHDSFEQAQDASKQSGKPVLLFQMMGRLDRQFC